jgi:predicted small metal-binding protein
MGRDMFAGKAVRCDCGHEVRANDAIALVEAIRRHAWEGHGIEFPPDLALDVAQRAELSPSSELTPNGESEEEER